MDRPESDDLKVDFRPESLNKDFRYIYNRRSLALHSGVPFPMPMCLQRNPQMKEERHFALGMSARGATWDFRKHKPLLFHTFEHIARGALLRWIGSL